jgi:glycosyltransferase A (GT-A) superfamily protein (DUF2064 family)
VTNTLIVIAKEPIAGRVKTRLVPPLSTEQAAQVAGAALADTLAAVQGAPARQRLLAFAGDVAAWLPAGWRSCRQPDGGLDRRLAAAFHAAGPGPALLLGMDTPQVRSAHLTAFAPERYDACLGPAPDGGYWALGFRDPRLAAPAILDIPMSTEHTGAHQLRRLQRLGLRVQLLEELRDVDTIVDADEVAALIPGSAFTAALAAASAAQPLAGAVR